MIKEFNTYLARINSELWKELCEKYGELRHFRKGDEFITLGRVAKYVGLIKSGSVKYVAYNTDNDEKIVGLETEGGFAASWPFCLHGIPSIVAIIANSDLEIYCLSSLKIKELANNDIELERQIAQSTEQVFYTTYERLISLYTESPKQRYEILLKKCPRVFEIFQLKDIASYLNITPVHLSRLKKFE